MFNKLVISTTERRKRRTARFFCGTAVFYMLSVAAAFAISIIASNPNLADTSDHSFLLITPALPVAMDAPRPAGRQAASAERRNDPNQVSDLDRVLANNTSAPRADAISTGPPQIGPVGAGEPRSGGGDGIIGWTGPEGFGTGGHDTMAPPPRPPDPPQPVAQAKPDDKRPVRLPSVVLQGKAIVRRTPDYPALAKQVRLEGSVSVEVMISPDGRVESARAVSGHALFKSTAEAAAQGWRFEPTVLNGIPVRVTGVIVFNFTLQ